LKDTSQHNPLSVLVYFHIICFDMFPVYQGHKISKISVYKVDLPLHESSYKWSGGKSVTTFDATVVQIETDTGFIGYGENTPLGPFYLPAYAEGTRAGVAKLAPALIGVDATRLNQLNVVMDRTLKGHPYVKSAIDMACWDILGKVSGLPVCELLGGRFNDSFKLYRAISQDTPEGMAKNVEKYVNMGYR
jgi:cis-L-3-hydroxyproline dehydratase